MRRGTTLSQRRHPGPARLLTMSISRAKSLPFSVEGGTRTAIARPAPLSKGADVVNSRDALEVRDHGFEALLDLDERPLVGVQEIDRHACSQVTTLRPRVCRARGSTSRDERYRAIGLKES